MYGDEDRGAKEGKKSSGKVNARREDETRGDDTREYNRAKKVEEKTKFRDED